MHTLILEPFLYSEKAINWYKILGSVSKGKVSPKKKKQVNILVVRINYKIDALFLDDYKNLKYIISPTTALTHIDMFECERRGIEVISLFNIKNKIKRISSTSELTLGLIINLLRKITIAHNDFLNNGSWNRDSYRSRELSNLSIGIVGIGRIGSHLATYCNALGMKVYGFDPFVDSKQFKSYKVKFCRYLFEMCSRVDILSINASLRDDNIHLIGKDEIHYLHKNALIINTARGLLLDEKSAALAIRSGKLGGIAVDVLSEENSQIKLLSSPLYKAAKDGFNVLITPHIGGCTSDAMKITEEAIAQYLIKKLN
jgi:D-3-phosphoglycerate dehydrogenase